MDEVAVGVFGDNDYYYCREEEDFMESDAVSECSRYRQAVEEVFLDVDGENDSCCRKVEEVLSGGVAISDCCW